VEFPHNFTQCASVTLSHSASHHSGWRDFERVAFITAAPSIREGRRIAAVTFKLCIAEAASFAFHFVLSVGF